MSRPSSSSVSLLSTWDSLVSHAPEACAVIDAGRAWSREDLHQASVKEELRLRSLGSLGRQRVALALPNGVAWLASFLALLRSDAVPVLLDPGEHPERLALLCETLGMVLLRTAEGWQVPGSTRERKPRRRPGSECVVKVTSGSTGLPKALPFDEASFVADGLQVCASMGIRASDTNVAVIPLGHSYGLGNLVLPLLLQGTAVHCVPTPLPSCLAEELGRWRSTVFPAVPALLRALARSQVASEALASLRLVISAGAPLSMEDARAFEERFKRPVHGFYGSSETGGITFDATGSAAREGRGVGTAMQGVDLSLRAGGRLQVRSAAVRGSRKIFEPADRAELSASGELRLLGRRGRLFKLGGRRLDLSGLEAEFAALPGVRGVVVEPHPSREEALAAVFACSLGLAELKALFLTRFPAWKLPARLRLVEDLPLTARGKVDRGRAVAWLQDQ